MVIELREAGVKVAQQQLITVHYHGEVVGKFVADIVVEDIIIVEPKSVRRIVKAHEMQLVNYLVAAGKDVSLILNFAEKEEGVKRKVRSLK